MSSGGDTVVIEWSRDSAFRFFPLVAHEDFGLVLHPFDLATNKVLALASRLEPRDWIDVILSSERVQPLGYLAWAACGKDPGFGPSAILEHAARGSRYAPEELAGLAFAGAPPDPPTCRSAGTAHSKRPAASWPRCQPVKREPACSTHQASYIAGRPRMPARRRQSVNCRFTGAASRARTPPSCDAGNDLRSERR